MSWGSRPEKYICKDCNEEFDFEMDRIKNKLIEYF